MKSQIVPVLLFCIALPLDYLPGYSGWKVIVQSRKTEYG